MTHKEQERLAALEAKFEGLEKTQDEIRADVKQILGFVARWKGMAAMLLMIGGAFGFLISAWDRVRGWF